MDNKGLIRIWVIVMLFLFVGLIAIDITVLILEGLGPENFTNAAQIIASTKFIFNLVVFQLGIITSWMFNNKKK